MRIRIGVPPEFNFRSTVLSHGWADLPPFRFDHTRMLLSRPLLIGRTRMAPAEFAQNGSRIIINLPSVTSLTSSARERVISQTRSIFRLDERLTDFYVMASAHPRFRWVKRLGAGRLLRAPTVFEDVVKMICTTNCSWALTKVITENLCVKTGMDSGCGVPSFPTPRAVARLSEKFLRKEIRAGYRAPYILELARRIENGDLTIERWRNGSLPPEELAGQIRGVRGVGPYAAGNLLKLLGRYEELGIDSWCRRQFSDMYRRGRPVSDPVIEKHYSRFGNWKGLFFWLDLTGEWYTKSFEEIFGA